jgi:hypothetical protein
MRQILITAVLSVLVVQVTTGSAPQASNQTRVNPSAKVLADFKDRIDAYIDLRKKADDGVPPLKETEHPAEITIAQETLARHIVAARAAAKHGDIFTPEITRHFRALLRPEVKQSATRKLALDDNPGNFRFNVNGPYPASEPLATVPPKVLASLPPLPADLEYRFVGKHLILRDSRANIIVDYIPNAIA